MRENNDGGPQVDPSHIDGIVGAIRQQYGAAMGGGKTIIIDDFGEVESHLAGIKSAVPATYLADQIKLPGVEARLVLEENLINENQEQIRRWYEGLRALFDQPAGDMLGIVSYLKTPVIAQEPALSWFSLRIKEQIIEELSRDFPEREFVQSVRRTSFLSPRTQANAKEATVAIDSASGAYLFTQCKYRLPYQERVSYGQREYVGDVLTKSGNDDRVAVIHLSDGRILAFVCDGATEPKYGEEASETVTDMVKVATKLQLANTDDAFLELIAAVNAEIARVDNKPMAQHSRLPQTTFTAAIINKQISPVQVTLFKIGNSFCMQTADDQVEEFSGGSRTFRSKVVGRSEAQLENTSSEGDFLGGADLLSPACLSRTRYVVSSVDGRKRYLLLGTDGLFDYGKSHLPRSPFYRSPAIIALNLHERLQESDPMTALQKSAGEKFSRKVFDSRFPYPSDDTSFVLIPLN